MNSIFNKIVAAFFVGVIAGALLYTPDCQAWLFKEKIGTQVNWVLYKQVKFDNTDYLPLVNRLNNAQEGETVRIILRKNGGGAVITMNIITHAMLQSKAKVITTVQGWAASAAAHILMHGDEVIIDPEAVILWHTGSVSFDGKNRTRLTPEILPWYLYAVSKQTYLYPEAGKYCTWAECKDLDDVTISLPTWTSRLSSATWKEFKINFDNKYRYISKEYWKIFLSGEDKAVSGATVCKWNLDQYPARDDREHYIGKGCKLTGVKGQKK